MNQNAVDNSLIEDNSNCILFSLLKIEVDIVLKHPPHRVGKYICSQGNRLLGDTAAHCPHSHCRHVSDVWWCSNWRWQYSEKMISVEVQLETNCLCAWAEKFLFIQGRFCDKNIHQLCVRCPNTDICRNGVSALADGAGKGGSWSLKLLSEHCQTLLTCLPDLVTTGTAPLSNVVTLCKCCQ